MATKKKSQNTVTPEETSAPAVITPPTINIKNRYRVIAQFKGQINNTKFSGKEGDIIEMEPWQARLLKLYVTEE